MSISVVPSNCGDRREGKSGTDVGRGGGGGKGGNDLEFTAAESQVFINRINRSVRETPGSELEVGYLGTERSSGVTWTGDVAFDVVISKGTLLFRESE